MRELFPGVPDDKLPKEAKERFFCKFHQDELGVVCETKRCETCGWNPLVQYRRIKKLKERMKHG